MFENILFQQRVVDSLRQEITQKTLPSALLFHGPLYSAKLTTALEFSRSVSCQKVGAWACDCKHCREHRSLEYPYLLLAGSRINREEIRAAASLLEQGEDDPRRYLFLRSVGKLLKHFDPVLWEGDESKLKKFYPLVEKIRDSLDSLRPGEALPEGDKRKKLLEGIVDQADKLATHIPSGGVPVDMVRRISFWVRNTSGHAPKTIILENVEKLSEGARNALLKILEEPPAATAFIMTTANRGAVMPTILSRSRSYAFRPRTLEEDRSIIRKIFREEKAEPSDLRHYFFSWQDKGGDLYRQQAREFLEALGQRETRSPPWKLGKEAEELHRVLDELLLMIQERHRERLAENPSPAVKSLDKSERFLDMVRELWSRRDSYNLASDLLWSNLYQRVRFGL